MKPLIFAVLFLVPAAAPISAADEVTQGKQVFQVCAACHSVDATNKTAILGPSLLGVVGRKAGSVPGFPYSRALKNSNIVWTAQNLDAYLANPQQLVPGNRMPFSGLPDAQQRRALIGYLETLR